MSHPLKLLTADEISIATRTFAACLTRWSSCEKLRWIEATLEEPASLCDREALLLGDPLDPQPPGSTASRTVKVVVWDRSTNKTFEGLVRLALDCGVGLAQMVDGPSEVLGVQPAMTADEYEVVERAVKEYVPFQDAMEERGIRMEQICVDPWCVGYFGVRDDPNRRLAKALVYVQDSPEDNLYARPLEGIDILVDLQLLCVVEMHDYKHVPVPPADPEMNYPERQDQRTSRKPLDIVQKDGPSFTVQDGNFVSWERWDFRVGFTAREGAVLCNVAYSDPMKGTRRPVAVRLSVSEMVVPYGDPDSPHYLKNAFDAGEDGLGRNAHNLSDKGCDCLGEVHFLDAALVRDQDGAGETISHAVCIHEEDAGILWKHMDWRSGRTEVRRSRRLVVSFVCTVANYEYGFYYKLYQDGTLELEVLLTGILSTGALTESQMASGGKKYGTTLNATGLYAPVHQHFFVARCDMAVDGLRNTVVEVEPVTCSPDPQANPFANAFYMKEEVLENEMDAKRSCRANRHWLVRSGDESEGAVTGTVNRTGTHTGYALHPLGSNTGVLADPSASFLRRAGFLKHHIWVTPFKHQERFPGGDYPNQNPSDNGEGLPQWTKQGRSIRGTDLVLWHVFGVTHSPRLEDWPVMPAEHTGFALKPNGFFDASPAMDVPPDKCCEDDITEIVSRL